MVVAEVKMPFLPFLSLGILVSLFLLLSCKLRSTKIHLAPALYGGRPALASAHDLKSGTFNVANAYHHTENRDNICSTSTADAQVKIKHRECEQRAMG